MKLIKSWKGKLAVIITVLAAALIPVVAHAAVTFGPDRKTFDWNEPNKYPNYVVFNSFKNNPTWGDERYVIKGRDSNASANSLNTKVNVTDGETVSLVVYFHNNAGTQYNLKAKDTTVKIDLPTSEAASQEVKGSISASNANPGTVWSTMDLVGNDPFTLEYEKGSARLSNYKFPSPGIAMSDNVVNGGALVGYDALDGKVPGCSEFSGYVLIHVKVHFKKEQPKPDYACNLLTLDVQPNRKVNASVTYKAVNGATFKNVSFDWGDSSAALLTTNTNASYTYPAAAGNGPFTVRATVSFNVNGNVKTATSQECAKQVSFTSPPTTPPTTTPPTTTVLPNTGPGSVIATFAGVSTFAGLFHYLRGRKSGYDL